MKVVQWIMVVLGALMLGVLASVAVAYVVGGSFSFWSMPAPKNASVTTEWANFGVFFGGVAGPILTALSGVAVALGFVLQANALNLTFKQVGMAAAHESLAWSRKKLDSILQQPLGSSAKTIQQLAVAHAQGRKQELTNLDDKALTEVLPDMLYWLGGCVQQVKLFQANNNPHGFTVQHEDKFYLDLLNFVEAHQAKLPGMLPITVGMLKSHYKA